MDVRRTWLRVVITALLCLLGAARGDARTSERDRAETEQRPVRASVRHSPAESANACKRDSPRDGDGDAPGLLAAIDAPAPCILALPRARARDDDAIGHAAATPANARGPPAIG